MSRTSAEKLMVLAILGIGSVRQTAAQVHHEDWYLKQYSKVQGEQEIWVSANAVKIANKNQRLSLLISIRKIYIWSDSEKLLYVAPLSGWHGLHRLSRDDTVEIQFGRITQGKVQSGELIGLPSQKIFYLDELSLSSGEPILRATVWTSKAFKLPIEICNAIQYYYALPSVNGFPLQCYRFSSVDGNYYPLRTTLIKRIPNSPARFKAPASYQEAKDESQLVFGKDKGEFIKNLTSD